MNCEDVEEVPKANVTTEDENHSCVFIYCTIALSILIISTAIAGVFYKVYKSRRWQVRTTTMDAFENPHYTKDPERSQKKDFEDLFFLKMRAVTAHIIY